MIAIVRCRHKQVLNANCVPAGFVNITTAGVPARSATLYNYQQLIQPPVVIRVAPLTGPVAGGTTVVIDGLLFGEDADVVFVERNALGTLTGGRSPCEWRHDPNLTCSDSRIR